MCVVVLSKTADSLFLIMKTSDENIHRIFDSYRQSAHSPRAIKATRVTCIHREYEHRTRSFTFENNTEEK